jgi:drug/metabolite transporter (DMT)-like permease
MRTRDLIDLLLLAAIWGASFLFMRVAAPEFGPVPLIAARVGIAALCLLAILASRGGLSDLRARVVPLTVLGAINSALPFSLFAYAVLSLTAGFAAVLNATVPLFGALAAYFWLGDKLAPTRVIGLIIGFAGVLVLVWGRISFADGSAPAVLAGLTASLSYGIAANYTKKRLTGVDPFVIATGNMIAATVLLLAPAMMYLPSAMPSASSWLSVIALGVMCTGIAYVLFFRLISRVGPAKAMTVTYLVPAFGVLWGSVFLDEAVTPNMVAASGVILLGTALATGTLDWRSRGRLTRVAARADSANP